MASLVALLKDLPAPIDAGWMLFAVWAIAQMVWYRRAHVEAPIEAPAIQPSAARRIPPRPRVAPVEARPNEAAGPPLDTIDVPDFPAPPSGVRGNVLGLGWPTP
jgi:hypothetical protein